jgi:hypothetical protein
VQEFLKIKYRQPAGALDPSGSPVTDCDRITFNDDRHLSRALGVLQHLLELCRVIVDIVILSIAVG